MRALWLSGVAICGLCGLSVSPSPAENPLIYEEVEIVTATPTELAFAVDALRAAHDDLRVAHDDLLLAHFDLLGAREDLLAFADDKGPGGPPKGKEKHADKDDKKKADEKGKGKPPHAGPPKKPHDDKGPKDKPHHEQMLDEIQKIRDLVEPGKKHKDKEADKHDGPPHEQVLQELRELRKAVEKRLGEKKK